MITINQYIHFQSFSSGLDIIITIESLYFSSILVVDFDRSREILTLVEEEGRFAFVVDLGASLLD